MCDPVTIGGIVLSGASMGLNSMAQSQVQSARDDALAAERIRQQGYDQEAAATNAHAQGQYENVGQKQTERAKSLADYYTSQQAQPTTDAGPVALPASSSNVTVQAENKARANAKQFTDKTGTALGTMRSFGDLMGEFARGTARDAGSVAQVGGFKKGSSSIVPYELEAANSKGQGLQTFGDILGGLGRIGVSAGLSGGLGGGGTSTVSAPFSYGAGGYTGQGPFLPATPSKNIFSIFGR